MKGKKAIELSMNFIIVLIISIIIFGFGIRFIATLFSNANDLQKMTVEDIDDQVKSLVCEGADRVCIGQDRKVIKRSSFDFFDIRVQNILDSQGFVVSVSASDPVGYNKDNQPIQLTAAFKGLSVVPEKRPAEVISKNTNKVFGVGISVPVNALSGTYILKVEIKTEDGTPYSQIHKLYVVVP